MSNGVLSGLNKGINLIALYKIIKRLALPFEKTKAFKLGIIDKNGKVLKKRANLTTSEEKDAYTLFDTFIFNIKKMINKVPGLRNPLVTFSAALFLLKECQITVEDLHMISENAPTNNISGGNIQPTDAPLITPKTIAGYATFSVNDDDWANCRVCKNRYERFTKKVKDQNLVKSVQGYAKSNPTKSIMVQNKNGAMYFLKRGSRG